MNPNGAQCSFGSMSLAEWSLKELGKTPDLLLLGQNGTEQGQNSILLLLFLHTSFMSLGPGFLITFNKISRNKVFLQLDISLIVSSKTPSFICEILEIPNIDNFIFLIVRKFVLIEGYLLYNVVLVSTPKHQHESAIGLPVSIPLEPPSQ